MGDQKEEPKDETTSSAAKPTITIAEREKEESSSAAKPTITIAERDGDK